MRIRTLIPLVFLAACGADLAGEGDLPIAVDGWVATPDESPDESPDDPEPDAGSPGDASAPDARIPGDAGRDAGRDAGSKDAGPKVDGGPRADAAMPPDASEPDADAPAPEPTPEPWGCPADTACEPPDGDPVLPDTIGPETIQALRFGRETATDLGSERTGTVRWSGELTKNDSDWVTFTVPEPGSAGIDFWFRQPTGPHTWRQFFFLSCDTPCIGGYPGPDLNGGSECVKSALVQGANEAGLNVSSCPGPVRVWVRLMSSATATSAELGDYTFNVEIVQRALPRPKVYGMDRKY